MGLIILPKAPCLVTCRQEFYPLKFNIMLSKNQIVVAMISSFFVGFLFSYIYIRVNNAAVDNNTTGYIIRQGQLGLIDPLLASEIGDKKEFYQFAPLEKKLKSKIDGYINDNSATEIGIYFRDLKTGRWTGVNEDGKFAPASLLKVPLLIAYLKESETDQNILSKKILYNGSFDDNAKEDIKAIKEIEAGKSYTIDELLEFMIKYSDNNATRLLFNDIDQKAMKDVFSDLGVQFPLSQDDYLGPKAYSLFFRVLFSSTYLSRAMSEKALELLAYNDFPQGLQAGVPAGITISKKFGEHEFSDGTRELHDCGIVYHTQNPYFVCVMTKGEDFVVLTNVIRDLSRLVYQEVNNNYKN